MLVELVICGDLLVSPQLMLVQFIPSKVLGVELDLAFEPRRENGNESFSGHLIDRSVHYDTFVFVHVKLETVVTVGHFEVQDFLFHLHQDLVLGPLLFFAK